MTKQIVHVLLSVFLLAVQVALLAHALEHLDDSHSNTVCEQCVAGSGFEHQAAGSVHPIALPSADLQTAPIATISSRTHFSAFFPRGPPPDIRT